MPSSVSEVIPCMIETIQKIKPTSILDIGVGFGKWGFLLREYLELWGGKDSILSKSKNFSWALKIDGIEVYKEYIKDLQRLIYNKIFIGNVLQVIDQIDNYDLLIMADVLEHFEKKEGTILLEKMFTRSNKAILITTPIVFWPQEALYNNSNECHKSIWANTDFKNYKNVYFGYTKISKIILITKTKLKFKLPNVDPIGSIVKNLIGLYQSRNVNKYGLHGINNGLFLKLYSYKRSFSN